MREVLHSSASQDGLEHVFRLHVVDLHEKPRKPGSRVDVVRHGRPVLVARHQVVFHHSVCLDFHPGVQVVDPVLALVDVDVENALVVRDLQVHVVQRHLVGQFQLR